MVLKKTASPSTLQRNFFVSMIAAGILLVAAAVVPWIPGAKQALPTDAVPLHPPARVQFPAPQLTLTDLRGMCTSLNDYRGRVVLLNNWGLPSSHLIGPDGTIQLAWLGQVNRPTLEKYVTPLLEI